MRKIDDKNMVKMLLSALFVLAIMAPVVSANTPNPVTDLQNITYAQNYINWTWIDPHQGYDFYVQVYINGTWKENVPKGRMFYNATGLSPNTNYEIGTRVVETSHYDASSWNNRTARTAPTLPDTTAPITTIVLTGTYVMGDWYSSTVGVVLTATDDRPGPIVTRYNLNGAGWTTYTTSFDIITEGTTNIQYNSTDVVGNVELIKLATVKIDTISPQITVTGVTNEAVYNTGITPIITITEVNPGSQSILLNDVSYVSGTPITADGNYWLNVSATDIVGHTASQNISFTIDITPPVVLRVHNLNTLENFATIQGAIDDSDTDNGDTITVDSGTYDENVNVNKQLVLRGVDTGGGKPIINAGGSSNVVNISAGGATFEGFIATNATNNGIYINSNNNIIRDNDVSDDNSSGIAIANGYYNTIERNIANGNTCGISVCHSGTNTIRDNDFDLNNAGIFMFNSHDNTLTNNTANENIIPPVNMRSPPSYIGIHLVQSNDNAINENYANSNSRHGISINASSNNILEYNTANDNVKNGIYVENNSYGNTISDNVANNNNHTGINIVQSSTGNVVERNTANYNTCGISTCHSGTTTIRHNIVNNNNAGIFTFESDGNTVVYNTANSNIGPVKQPGVAVSAQTGIYLYKSNGGVLDNNTISNNRIGITLRISNDSQIKNNTDILNTERGIYVRDTDGNTIYNNHFNNTQNILLAGSYNNNIWNITKVLGINIIGGQYLGGNYWAQPDGYGFSQTCDNGNGDGICDSGYRLNGEWDNLPLTNRVTTPPPVQSVCNGNQTNPCGFGINYNIS